MSNNLNIFGSIYDLIIIKFIRYIFVVTIIGIIIRLIYVSHLPNKPIDPDEKDYYSSAIELKTNYSFEKVIYYHVPPFVPIMYAFVLMIIGDGYFVFRLFHCLLFIPIMIVTYNLSLKVGNHMTAIIAVTMISFYPYHVFYFSKIGLKKLLENENFEIEEIKYFTRKYSLNAIFSYLNFKKFKLFKNISLPINLFDIIFI